MLMSWAAYSSTSSLSRSVHSWLAESSGTKIMSLFSFICFYLRPFRSSPASLPVWRNRSKSPAWIVPFSRERSHCGQTFFQRRRIRLGFGTRDPLAGYLVLQSRGLYRDMKKASLRKLFDGADNGTRTRGLNLGKVALYQLSYVRKCFPPWWATSRKYT